MLSRRLAQPSMRADGLPSAAPALNSAQARTDSGFHCTIVCCGLNLHRGAAAVAPDPPVAGAPVVGTASLERAARAGWAALPERTARLARARHGQ